MAVRDYNRHLTEKQCDNGSWDDNNMTTALICMLYQSGVGEWGSEYLSSMFGMLDRLAHPLSAFLVLRSVPLLIREQRSDGFWHENLKGNCPPPKPEESTFIILSTLKRFNYLDALLPNRVKQRH